MTVAWRALPAMVLVAVLAAVEPAGADPARPTDYRSSVDAVVPEVRGLRVEILGGDAFVRLVAGGHSVTIIGYRGEPSVRVSPSGVVEENLSSPSVALNRNRYGGGDTPTSAVGPPRWQRVGSDGTYVWHDHRTHWMSPVPPAGLAPGDRILEGVIPLVVDGRPVKVQVSSTWVPPPSPAGPLAGLAVGAALGWVMVRRRAVRSVLGVTASVALVFGLWQFWSLPSATGASITLWVLPLVALVVVGASGWLGRMLGVSPLLIAALGAVELGLWAWSRREGLGRAILPTAAPAGLDRAITAAVGVVALVALLVISRALLEGRVSGRSGSESLPVPVE